LKNPLQGINCQYPLQGIFCELFSCAFGTVIEVVGGIEIGAEDIAVAVANPAAGITCRTGAV